MFGVLVVCVCSVLCRVCSVVWLGCVLGGVVGVVGIGMVSVCVYVVMWVVSVCFSCVCVVLLWFCVCFVSDCIVCSCYGVWLVVGCVSYLVSCVCGLV